jgi:hypothetical protein
LTSRLERTVLSKKIIEEDLSQIEESATKSKYKLGVGLRDVRKRVRRMFLAPTTTKRRKHSNQP